MLRLILDLLKEVDVNDGELIAIAKGKNQLPNNFKELKQAIKWQLQKK
jgi:hypothetical protein